MASAIDICNLALGHLGDTATVSSIDPPEGSAQAEHCARFYPIARDSLLEMHLWNFSVRRVALAQVTNNWTEWTYAYMVPADVNNIIAVLAPDAPNDYSTFVSPIDGVPFYAPTVAAAMYTPQQYTVESMADGTSILYANQSNAVLRYTSFITDTTKFSPLFIVTLSWHLASMLAGPLIKGDAGAAEAKRCQGMMTSYLTEAQMSDSNQRNIKPEHVVNWMSGR